MLPQRDDRAQAEAIVLLGREAVERALADPMKAAGYIKDHPEQVLEAIGRLRAFLPDRVTDAVAYASALPQGLREALAGAWVGDSALRAMNSLGIEEEEDA